MVDSVGGTDQFRVIGDILNASWASGEFSSQILFYSDDGTTLLGNPTSSGHWSVRYGAEVVPTPEASTWVGIIGIISVLFCHRLRKRRILKRKLIIAQGV